MLNVDPISFSLYYRQMAFVPLCERVFKYKSQAHFEMPKSIYGRPKQYKSWNNEILQQASDAVHRQGMHVLRAAEECAIPRSTLHDHISGRVLLGAKKGQKACLQLLLTKKN